jgi:hypothetical protein
MARKSCKPSPQAGGRLFATLISILSFVLSVFAVWEVRAARRESIPRPLVERHGHQRVGIFYPAEMAQPYGIEAVACPDNHELRRWDTLTIEQAASLPPEVERGYG